MRRHGGRCARAAACALLLAPGPSWAEEESPTPAFFDVNKYRADPGNPGAIKIPGTNVAVYLGGFAQLDAITDVNVTGNPDQFVVSSIPVGGGTGDTGVTMSARQSRVFIETDAPWTVAPLLAYVELDFFDPQNQSDFHLRHAFGAIGRPDHLRLVAGHTFTTFMDATVIPNQLDYAGPAGLVNLQQAQARLVVPWLGLEWNAAIEAPDAEISVPMGTQATSYARWPDLVAAVRWKHGHGHVLVSGVFRQLGIFPAAGEKTATVGYGGNFTGSLTNFWGQDHFLWAVAGGRGISSYFAGTNGLGLDAFLGANGELSATTVVGVVGSYTHTLWGDRIGLTATYSLLRLFGLGAGSDATLERLQYAGGMLQVFPNKRFMTGAQYLYGQRQNRDGQSAADNRVQLSTQLRF